jgi:hypothetical protein
MGPEQAGSGWRVIRVLAVEPGRSRPFREVRDLVQRAWADEEGERLMRALLARARTGVRVRLNEPAIDAIAAAGADAARCAAAGRGGAVPARPGPGTRRTGRARRKRPRARPGAIPGRSGCARLRV